MAFKFRKISVSAPLFITLFFIDGTSLFGQYYPNLAFTSTKTLAPGVIHRQATLPSPANKVNIFIIDPTAGGAMLVPARPAGLNGLVRTSVQATSAKAIAAVNAGFFAYSGGQNLTKKDGVILEHDPTLITNGRSAVGFSGLHQSKPLRVKIKVDGTPSNTSHVGASEWPEIVDFIGGRGHARVVNGNLTIDNENSGTDHYSVRHPRTAIGYSKSPYRIFLCTVDGRNAGGSVGMTFQEHGQLMADLGAEEILFLDGGGSTTAWTKADGVVNSPSDGSERSVNSIWTVVPGVTVDNRDSEFASAGGGWSNQNNALAYDRNHRYLSAGAASRKATWKPNLVESGRYDVYTRWVADSTRSPGVQYSITHRQGTTNVTRNQTTGGNSWNLLGTFNFNAGNQGAIVLNAISPDYSYSADAIRLIRIGDATVPPTSPGKLVTVAKEPGAANFQSIQDAIDSFPVTDLNPSIPNTIQILDSDVYDEAITIDKPLLLKGLNEQRPVIAVKGNSQGRSSNGGILVNLPSSLSTGTVTLENLTIIPSQSTSHGKITTAIENKNNNLFLFLNNILIAPNDGENKPLVANGFTDRSAEFDADQSAAGGKNFIPFGDDALYLGNNTGVTEGQGLELLMRNSTVTHIRAGDTTNQDGLVAVSVFTSNPTTRRKIRVEDNCVISYCGRIGLQITGDFELDSPSQNTYIIGNGSGSGTNPGIWLANSVTQKSPIINGGIFLNNKGEAIRDSAISGGYRAQISNSIIYHTGLNSVLIEGAATRPMTISNSTIIRGNNTGNYGPVNIASGVNCPLTLKDCIIGGHSALSGNNANAVVNGGTGTVTLNGTALITQGPWAMRSTGITGTYTGLPATNADPHFVAPTDYPQNNFNVTNGVYSNVASTGNGLGGGAKYIGPPASVAGWMLY